MVERERAKKDETRVCFATRRYLGRAWMAWMAWGAMGRVDCLTCFDPSYSIAAVSVGCIYMSSVIRLRHLSNGPSNNHRVSALRMQAYVLWVSTAQVRVCSFTRAPGVTWVWAYGLDWVYCLGGGGWVSC